MCYLISNAVNNEIYSTQCQSNIFNLYHRNSVLIITYMHTNTSLLFPVLFIMSMHTQYNLFFIETENNVTQIVLQCF